jgi:hypothetical protein
MTNINTLKSFAAAALVVMLFFLDYTNAAPLADGTDATLYANVTRPFGMVTVSGSEFDLSEYQASARGNLTYVCNGVETNAEGWLACNHVVKYTELEITGNSTFEIATHATPERRSDDYWSPPVGWHWTDFRYCQQCCDRWSCWACKCSRERFCDRTESGYWFHDWDRQLSSIGSRGSMFQISSGVTISEGWQGGFEFGALNKYFPSVQGQYQRQYQTNHGIQYNSPPITMNYGLLVVNAYTWRTNGWVGKTVCRVEGDEDCWGPDPCSNPSSKVWYWNRDRRFSGGYNFVKGVYQLAESDSIPVPCKIGNCVHYG